MNRVQRPILGWLALAVAATAARGNTPEDVYGLSARTNAMGGAGTALPGDYAATHYNPAGLAACREDHVAADASAIFHSLGFSDNRAGNGTKLAPRTTRDQGRFMFGACLGLPFDLTLGLALGVGYPGSISVDQQTANDRPTYVMYGENHEQATIAMGLAWRAAPWISVGVGMAVLVSSQLPVVANIPVGLPDPDHPDQNKPVSFSVALGIGGAVAPRLGVLVTPLERLRFGLALRGALYHNLQIETDLEVETALVNVSVPLHLDSLSWYSPAQLAFGVSGEPAAPLTLTADATWYKWGALADNTYPFINVFSKPGSPADVLFFPTVEHPGWQDVVALRGGAELRLLEDRFVLRGGLGWRGAAVDNPDDSNVNLLDGAVVTVTGGVGAYLGRRAPPPGRVPDPGPRARTRVGSWDIPTFSGSIEAFVRLDHMGTHTVRHASTGADDPVPEKDYQFGGSVFQLGMTATLAW